MGQSVLGQHDFTHSTINFVRGKGLNLVPDLTPLNEGIPPGIAVDSVNGCVYIADSGNNRVLGWKNEAALANGATADIVIGQPDPYTKTANSGGLSNSTLSAPTGVATDPTTGNLYIADNGNQRVVAYLEPCTSPSSTPTPTLIFNVGDPWGLATDSLGNLFVADRNNNRVLEYNTPLNASSGEPGAGDTNVDNIFGQGLGGGNACNQGINGPTAGTLCKPYGVGTDGQTLYIADSANNRVVGYAVPTTAGVFPIDPAAVLVIGQNSFTSATSGCTSASSQFLCNPEGVAADLNHNVYAADTGNNRVLEYNNPSPGKGAPPFLLIGQPGLTTNLPNAGGAVGDATLWSPAGIATDTSGNLFVLDDRNFRAVVYSETTNPPINFTGNTELGQFNFLHNTANFIDGSSLSNPSAVAIDLTSSETAHLYVVDSDNNRVLGFNNATTFADGGPADLVIGQPDFYSVTCNGTGANSSTISPPSASTLCLNSSTTGFPQGGDAAVDTQGNLWVSDDGNGRVLEFPAPFASKQAAGESATVVLGQPNLTTGSPGVLCTSTTASATNLCEPAGLAFDTNDNLYVADFGYNRVLMFTQPGSSGTSPLPASRVFGQDFTGTKFDGQFCNMGTGAPTADILCGPLSVALDTDNDLYVADFNNNRVVLYYDPSNGKTGTPGTPGSSGDVTADLAFGQDPSGVGQTYTSALCNNGGISATSLCNPSGVGVDLFGTVFISDQSNNRVLAYPEGPGPASDVVAQFEFGQPSHGFTTGLVNNGGLSAGSLNLARTAGQQDGLALDGGGNLYVADAGNERMLGYNGPFLHGPTPTPTPTVVPSPTPTTMISPSPDMLKMGKVEATASGKTKKLTLENTGAVAAQIGQLSATDFTFPTDNCSNTALQPGQKCTVDVAFSPATIGGVSETINVPYNGIVPSVILSGTGTAAALSAPKSKNLPGAQAGQIGKAVNITISNKSKVAISVGTPLTLINSTITADACSGQSLAPKAKCVVTVEFSPLFGTSGKLTDSLSYSYTYGANTGRVSTALTGTADGDLTASPKSKTMPGAPAGGLGKPVNFTITNQTQDTVTMGATPTVTDFTITSDACNMQSLAPGAQCVIGVEFAPPSSSFSGKTITETLSYSFTFNSSNGTVDIPLTGKVSKS